MLESLLWLCLQFIYLCIWRIHIVLAGFSLSQVYQLVSYQTLFVQFTICQYLTETVIFQLAVSSVKYHVRTLSDSVCISNLATFISFLLPYTCSYCPVWILGHNYVWNVRFTYHRVGLSSALCYLVRALHQVHAFLFYTLSGTHTPIK